MHTSRDGAYTGSDHLEYVGDIEVNPVVRVMEVVLSEHRVVEVRSCIEY